MFLMGYPASKPGDALSYGIVVTMKDISAGCARDPLRYAGSWESTLVNSQVQPVAAPQNYLVNRRDRSVG